MPKNFSSLVPRRAALWVLLLAAVLLRVLQEKCACAPWTVGLVRS